MTDSGKADAERVTRALEDAKLSKLAKKIADAADKKGPGK